MSKRKMFGVSASISRGLSETISIVENNSGVFRNAVIPITRIEADPENPRRLLISKDELLAGLDKLDPLYKGKQEEMIKLKELAVTIQNKGLIQPITVYKKGETYRVVAGNRRFFASILAQKKEIEARILTKTPEKADLKLIQWIENTVRDDLSLMDKIGNINAILHEYRKNQKNVKVTSGILSDLTGLSVQQASAYFSVAVAPDDVQRAIAEGIISNLHKAVIVSSVKDAMAREATIALCAKSCSISQLRSFAKESVKQNLHKKIRSKTMKRGRAATRVSLGVTKRMDVVKDVIFAVIEHSGYKIPREPYEKLDWNSYDQVTKAFKDLLITLENSKR